MTDWSADPWFAEHAWVAPRVGETRRSGFKSLRPHAFSVTGPAGQRQSFRLRGGAFRSRIRPAVLRPLDVLLGVNGAVRLIQVQPAQNGLNPEAASGTR